MRKQIAYFYTLKSLYRKQLAIATAFSKQHDYQKFILLSSPRCGSTLLHTYLNANPQIHSLGEEPWRDAEWKISRDYFPAYPKLIRSSGFKVFYLFQNVAPYRSLYQKLTATQNLKVIHLSRENLLEQYLSFKQAWQHRTWSQSGPKQPDQPMIKLEKDEFEAFKNEQQRQKTQCLMDFSQQDICPITYEDLTEQPDKTLRLVQEFLGVKPRRLVSLLEKQQQLTLEEILINAREVKEWFPEYFE